MPRVAELIFKNVKQRGYADGWTPRQLLARQAVKLLEEVCELVLAFMWPGEFLPLLVIVETAKHEARRYFDNRELWGGLGRSNIDDVLSEAADCRVVLAVIEVTAEQITGRPVGLETAALLKSGGDVERGVRNGAA